MYILRKPGLSFKALSLRIGAVLPALWLCTALRRNEREKHLRKVGVALLQAQKIEDPL